MPLQAEDEHDVVDPARPQARLPPLRLALIANVPDEGEPKTNHGEPFIADGLAAGAYNEDGVDVTLIRMFLRLTPTERLDQASAIANGIEELRALRPPRVPTTFDFRRALTVLAEHHVEGIVVGGISAILQGAPVVTIDLDIMHRRTPENVRRLLAALRSIDARYRHGPRGFIPEETHLPGPGHDLRQTICGPLDALGAIDAGLAYDDLLPDSEELRIGSGLSTRVLSLRRLVELKSASGRPKDLAALPTLRATLAEVERKRGA